MKPQKPPALVSTTKAMILKAVDGDKVSFDKFVLRYQDQVANFFFKNLGDRKRSLELTRETFKFYNYLSRYNSAYRPYTLLFSIARNLCINEYRTRKREEKLSKKLKDEAEEGFEVHEIKQDIDKALRKLPENQRMAIILKFFSGLNSKEIAGILDTSENNKVWIFRGCEKLSSLLEKE